MKTDKEIAKFLGIKLTSLQQLKTYVKWAEQGGVYWNPKNQFGNRHKEIKSALNMFEEENIN